MTWFNIYVQHGMFMKIFFLYIRSLNLGGIRFCSSLSVDYIGYQHKSYCLIGNYFLEKCLRILFKTIPPRDILTKCRNCKKEHAANFNGCNLILIIFFFEGSRYSRTKCKIKSTLTKTILTVLTLPYYYRK